MRLGITNLKGGVGKTTLSVNLAVCFAHLGYKTAIVDTDVNQNSFQWYSERDTRPDIFVVGATDPKGLMKIVNTMAESYDVVIMDGLPSISDMNIKVMLAADVLLIPTRPGAHDYRTMRDFMVKINDVLAFRPNLEVRFVLNEFDPRQTSHKLVFDSLGEFGVPVLQSKLKNRAAFSESNMSGTGAYEHHDPKAKAEILALTEEIREIGQQINMLH